jgi:small-conductance mechanosensitive channel
MSLGDWSIFVLFQGLLAVLAVATFFIVRFLRNILLRRRINSRAKISIEALFSIFKQAILPLYFIAALTAILELSSFANTTIANVSTAIYKSFSYGILLYVLARIFLSPRDETKRIFRVTTPTAKRIFTFLNFAAINVFIHQFINNSNLVSAFPEGLNDGFNIIYAAITIFISASVLYIVTKNHRENEISIESHQTLINWRIGRPVLWVLTLLILAAILTGYINLAEFSTTLIYNLVITSAFFWLFLEIIDNALSQLFHQNSSFTRDLSNFFGLKHNRIRQAGVILVGFMRILIVLLFVAILAENFGFYSSDWFIWIKRAFFGFSIGNIVISPATILTVIVIAILGFAATKAIQNWLGNQYLPTTELDHGVRNSISTVFGYTGTIIVCLFAATYAGLNFQNLAIIFGALSVGIGFGLQSIVGNFVSGLILLAERPIKVGDWIITSGGEGTVRNISVRSTQIETFDRSTIIVPNQTLITEPVSNWTFRNELGRIKVAVGTDYNSDPEQVRDILIECAKEHKGILNYPEPHVLFLNMGADALEFELRAYLKDIGNGAFVKSDLRFAILKALREADINIPFPQRHVHIEGLEKLINAKDDKEE